MSSRVFTRAIRSDDDGFALVAVVGALFILTAFALTALTFALTNSQPARADQDSKAALAAAQAGIDEYVSRLNVTDNYWTQGNTDSTNLAFTSGVTIPGTNGQTSSFTYKLISSAAQTAQDGIIRLRATGTENGVSRSLTAQLQPVGFLKYIYYTDVEDQDPALFDSQAFATVNNSSYYQGQSRYQYVASAAAVDAICSQYYYAGRANESYRASATYPYYIYDSQLQKTLGPYTDGSTVANFCREIQFTSGDVINGPLHSNDALQINGSTLFSSNQTETSWADSATPAPSSSNHRWWGTGTPSGAGYLPTYAAPIALPQTNSQLVAYANSTSGTGAGCTYTGATRITFTGTTMKVLSPNTTDTNTPSRCLDVSNRANEQTKAIPPVIYVQGATSCTTGVGYPQSGEDITQGITTDYSCKKGTAFISGTVSGKVTVGTADDIVVTGDLKYQNGTSGTDVVGLIPNHYVWVYHPVKSNGANLLSNANSVHEIDAAILCIQDSFLVQNWDAGTAISNAADSSSKLTVVGSISQKYRGPVGTGSGTSVSTGYLKNYVYDQRLNNLPPPYFLKPQSSPWQATLLTDG